MAEPSGRHRIRNFLSSRKHKRQPSDPQDLLRASNTSSVVSLSESAIVAMEGNLKKRLAKMPVMHDRYCVATWEVDVDERKRVMLRSYKSQKAYDSRPEKPSSIQQLKCISDWDGKTGFHRYQNAFTMETSDKKLYQCVAPCPADKVKWMGLMAIRSRRDRRLYSVGNMGSRRRTQSVEVTPNNSKPRAYTGPSMAQSEVNAAQSTNFEEQNTFSSHDRLFRTASDTSVNLLDESTHDENEPVDWGLCGNEITTYKYEVQEDSIPVLLDQELLDTRERENKTLATDKFLFDEAGASRFGTVFVKDSGRDEENGDADFVDEDLAARKAKKENERNMKRRAQKLESNRDRYAEMAAARLAGMRKDARHPKKRHGHRDVSLFVSSDDSNAELYDEEHSIVDKGEGVAELEDTSQRRSSLDSRCSLKSHKQSFVSNSDKANSVKIGYASGENEVNMEDEDEEVVPFAAVTSTQIFTAESAEAEARSADAELIEVDIAEVEEAEKLRQLKKKNRAERRTKKRLTREKEKKEHMTLEAAELARTYREEQRAREEAKAREEQQKRLKKKEPREVKVKLKREDVKQRQAEAEFLKLAELNQAEKKRCERKHTEKMEKKKSKKKEKYTSIADRIQRKEVRDAKRAAAFDEAETSNALVVLEKPVNTETMQQSIAASAAPVLTSTSLVQTEAASTQQTACVSASSTFPPPSPVAVPVIAPTAVSSSATEVAAAAAQTMPTPMYQMCPPPFVPSYPTGPQSMPAYGLAATFGAYPPFYLAPYNYGGPTGLQSALVRPNMRFVSGLSAMNSFGTATGPAEPMIGPQLPISKESADASLTGASTPPFPMDKSTCSKLTNLPELPDVIGF